MSRKLVAVLFLIVGTIVAERHVTPAVAVDALPLERLPLQLGAWSGQDARPY